VVGTANVPGVGPVVTAGVVGGPVMTTVLMPQSGQGARVVLVVGARVVLVVDVVLVVLVVSGGGGGGGGGGGQSLMPGSVCPVSMAMTTDRPC